MKGREHMLVGSTATATIGIGLLISNTGIDITDISLLVFGGIVGSYMPDIDSKNSKAGQIFNKIIAILLVVSLVAYFFELSREVQMIMEIVEINLRNNISIIFFVLMIILGKISPHRMFTHKCLGTLLFCLSVYFLGYLYFTLGFVTGYILHILCDSFTPNGSKLRFFEFKLPCKNSKNKLTINW